MHAGEETSVVQLDALYKGGDVSALISRLQEMHESNPEDARTTFRLANLLALQEYFEEALRLYDLSWLDEWPGALCLNNQGVVYAWKGEGRAAVDCFRRAIDFDPECAPSHFNLAIICEHLASDSSAPRALHDVGLLEAGEAPRDHMMGFYEQADQMDGAAASKWSGDFLLDCPLYLWVGDLRPSFGFEFRRETADVVQAHELYAEGLELLDSEHWVKAIQKFEAAGLVSASVVPRSVAPIAEARAQLCKEHLTRARELWKAGEYNSALNAYNSTFTLLPDIPYQRIVENILIDEAQWVGLQVARADLSGDWTALWDHITAVRQIADQISLRFNQSVTGSSVATRVPEDGEDPQSGAFVGTDTHEISASSVIEHLKATCIEVWTRQLTHLMHRGKYETAEHLVESSPPLVWFAGGELDTWRRKLFTEQANIAIARGVACFEAGDEANGLQHWLSAERAAENAKDSGLAKEIRDRIQRVTQPDLPRADLDSLHGLMNQGEYESALRKVDNAGKKFPASEKLPILRRHAVDGVINQIERAIESEAWDVAIDTARSLLSVVSGHHRTIALLNSALAGRRDNRLASARAAFAHNDLKAAGEFAKSVLTEFPQDNDAHGIIRDVEIRSSVDFGSGEAKYGDALRNFTECKAEFDAVAAFDYLLKLRELGRDREETKDATTWCLAKFVDHLRSELEQSRTKDVAEKLDIEIEKIFSIAPKDPTALAFREELAQVRKEHDIRRRQESEASLDEAAKTLIEDRDPLTAFDALQIVEELAYEGHTMQLVELRARATALIRTQIENCLDNPTPECMGQVPRLLRRYDGAEREELQERYMGTGRAEVLLSKPAAMASREETVESFRAIANQTNVSPLELLKILAQEIKDRESVDRGFRKTMASEIRELKQLLQARLSIWQRILWYSMRFFACLGLQAK